MSKQDNCASKALYEQQEKKISAQSDAMIKLLTKKGILEDRQIDDERPSAHHGNPAGQHPPAGDAHAFRPHRFRDTGHQLFRDR